MKLLIVLIACLLLQWATAQDRDFTLTAPSPVIESGFLEYILPRFSLKHGTRVQLVPEGGDAVIGDDGVAVFVGLGTDWFLDHNGDAGPVLFAQWLASDIGKRTIVGFKPDGVAIFSGEVAVETIAADLTFEGDPVMGESLSLHHCGRCHVINETNRMKGMGATPSFALMRTFPDWQNRFSTFYVLNPHPSFSQVENLTPPFPLNLPPAIVPLEITQDDLDAILAYVATIPPAELGAPLQTQ